MSRRRPRELDLECTVVTALLGPEARRNRQESEAKVQAGMSGVGG